ncbi:MAG: hypothetical protein H6738_14340 [Alphaproteobacteria bacterium]|nr:hypothetical protein [Alphaproteobacteria bacterium]MCB9697954.1 hypothetical protein [Alphaproteobacteria bacterium]
MVTLLFLAACRPETDPDPTEPVHPPKQPHDTGAGAPAVTWREVGPILEERCISCHREGEIAPIELDTWEAAAPWAASIAQATRERSMPPYLVDPTGSCQEFTDPGWLSDAELDTLQAWADDGAPSGGSPERLEPHAVDHIDAPDAVLDMGVSFTPNEPPDQYRCFIADLDLPQDMFMTGYEVVAGNPSIVHHLSMFTLDDERAQRRAEELDAADPIPGYECYFSAEVGAFGSRQISGWAVGTPTTRLPDGTGLRLYAHRPVVFSVHYHTVTPADPDRTVIRLELAETVEEEAYVFRPFDVTMSLPPGEDATTWSYTTEMAQLLGTPGVGATVHGIFPHMHQRGTAMRMEVTGAGPNEGACLGDVPAWDFDWQRAYFYRQPLRLEATDLLRSTCVYDTSADSEPVRFGESSDDEMCVFGVLVTL